LLLPPPSSAANDAAVHDTLSETTQPHQQQAAEPAFHLEPLNYIPKLCCITNVRLLFITVVKVCNSSAAMYFFGLTNTTVVQKQSHTNSKLQSLHSTMNH